MGVAKIEFERIFFRESLVSEVTTLFIFQIALCYLVLTTSEIPTYESPPSMAVAYTRLMAGMFMQIMMSRELKEGLDKMKFAINHPWKFENIYFAFCSGLMQTITIVLVTIINYYTIL